MSVRLRPRFGLSVSLSPEQVMTRFQERVVAGGLPCEFNLLENQVEVSVPTKQRHFWSPVLNVLVEAAQDDGAILRGKFGPNINLWTMFLAAYAVLFLVGATGMIAAVSQLTLGQTPSGFFMSAGCLVVAALIWAAGRLGQRWAHDQMAGIHGFMHEIFADAIRAGEDGPSG